MQKNFGCRQEARVGKIVSALVSDRGVLPSIASQLRQVLLAVEVEVPLRQLDLRCDFWPPIFKLQNFEKFTSTL